MRKFILICAIALFVSGIPSAQAGIYNDGGIHNITTQVTPDFAEDVFIMQDTTLNLLSGGVFGNSVMLWEPGATLNVYDGRINNLFYLYNGEANIYGGNMKGDLWAGLGYGSSVPRGRGDVLITGGLFDNPHGVDRLIGAAGDGTIQIKGGNFTENEFRTAINGVITVYGTGFNYAYGEIGAVSGDLTGFLESGEELNVRFSRFEGGRIILAEVPDDGPEGPVVPEPATLMLFGVGGIAMAVVRRRKK